MTLESHPSPLVPVTCGSCGCVLGSLFSCLVAKVREHAAARRGAPGSRIRTLRPLSVRLLHIATEAAKDSMWAVVIIAVGRAGGVLGITSVCNNLSRQLWKHLGTSVQAWTAYAD